MEKIKDIINTLEASDVFKQWLTENDGYLVNLFNEIDSEIKLSSNWKVGYYVPKIEKVVTFTMAEEITSSVDDILGEKGHIPEFMADNDSEVAVVLEKVKSYFDEKYPKNVINKGWVVVNTQNEEINYSFTLLSGQHVIILSVNAEGTISKDEKHSLLDWMQSVKGERKSGM